MAPPDPTLVRGPVLVTGAAGFIGRRLIDRLVGGGVEVAALLLPGEAVPEPWGEGVRIVRGDVCDPDSVDRALDGVATVFHLAALVAEQNSDYDAHWAVTAEGSRNVYAAAGRRKARVVVTTSICAYGDRIARDVCREDSERGLHQGPYGRAKQGQEDFARDAHEKEGLAVTIVRPSNVYGVGSKPWVELLSERLLAGQMAVLGEGSGNAGLVYVENLVDALIGVATRDEAIGRTYNVCDGSAVSWRRYMNDLSQILGVAAPPSVPRELLYEAAAGNEDPEKLVGPRSDEIPPLELLNLVGSDNRFPTDRIRADIGWAPRVTYEESLRVLSESLASRKS